MHPKSLSSFGWYLLWVDSFGTEISDYRTRRGWLSAKAPKVVGKRCFASNKLFSRRSDRIRSSRCGNGSELRAENCSTETQYNQMLLSFTLSRSAQRKLCEVWPRGRLRGWIFILTQTRAYLNHVCETCQKEMKLRRGKLEWQVRSCLMDQVTLPQKLWEVHTSSVFPSSYSLSRSQETVRETVVIALIDLLEIWAKIWRETALRAFSFASLKVQSFHKIIGKRRLEACWFRTQS